MLTYLFYDIETTGLNKAFDQILQFAAIRTDLAFQELERYELKIKLNPDIIPSPKAMLTHLIGVHEALEGIPEIEAIQQIHHWLNEPGTISLGYNTLGFDDEFLRFSFYRNLLPPYTHQYANQCSRMDLYPLAVMFYQFKHSVIKWPHASLRLEQINAENQFVNGRAHHAMVDVEITLALAKSFAQEQAMWEYLLGYFNKKIDQERAQELSSNLSNHADPHVEGLLLDGVFGFAKCFQCPVLFLGTHHHYKNQTLWLQLDSSELRSTTENTIAEKTWVSRKKWGEPGFILPPKERFLSQLSKDRVAIVEANKQWLKQNPTLFEKIIEYHRSYQYPLIPETDIDARLYLNEFWSFDDEKLCRQFHKVIPSEKVLVIEKMQNPALRTLALRLLGRHYPDTLSAEQTAQFANYLLRINPPSQAQVLLDYKGKPKMTPQAALLEIAELRQNRNLQHAELLTELENYLKRFNDCTTIQYIT